MPLVDYILEQFETCPNVRPLPREKWDDFNAVNDYSDELFHVKLPRRYAELRQILRFTLDPDDWRID